MVIVYGECIFGVEMNDSCAYDSVGDVVSSSLKKVFSGKWIEVPDRGSPRVWKCSAVA